MTESDSQAAMSPEAIRETLFGPAPAPEADDPFALLHDLTRDVLFGRVWSRMDELDLRTRGLCTVSVLTALQRPQLPVAIKAALRAGASRREVAEAIVHVGMYAGWPTAVYGAQCAREVFAERQQD